MRTGRKKVGLIKLLHMGYSECPKGRCLPAIKKKKTAITIARTLPLKKLNKQEKNRAARVSLNVDSTPCVGIRSPKAKNSDSCLLYQKRNLIVKQSPPNPEFPFVSVLISEAGNHYAYCLPEKDQGKQ